MGFRTTSRAPGSVIVHYLQDSRASRYSSKLLITLPLCVKATVASHAR